MKIRAYKDLFLSPELSFATLIKQTVVYETDM